MNIKKVWAQFKLICILLAMLITISLWGYMLPIEVKSFFYAISLSLNNILIFCLPYIVFVFLWSALITLQNQAGKFILYLVITVTLSNFIAIMTSYTVGVNIIPFLNFKISAINIEQQLLPTWSFELPNLISTRTALIVGIISGLFFAFKPNVWVNSLSQKLNHYVIHFFRAYFTPILPIFILGFLCKLEHEKILSQLLLSYSPIFILVASLQVGYVSFMYLMAANFKISTFWTYIKNILPAGITAFSTISSAATLPVTILATEKNLQDKNFARIIIPATCNIHAIGSSTGFPILALATLYSFNMGLPNLHGFITFAIYFALSKYAVAGVPGGIIVIAAQLTKNLLGFTPEMLGIVTTVYLLLDTTGTATNVTANGAFAMIFKKLYTMQQKNCPAKTQISKHQTSG